MTPKLTSAPYSYALIWRFVCPTTYSRFVLWHRMEVTNLMCPKPNFPYPSHKLANLSKGNCIFQLFSTPKFKLFLIAFFSHIWHLSVNAVSTNFSIHYIRWIINKAREFQKNIYFCFIDYSKAFDCVDHNKLWKILKKMGIPDHLTCLLRNLYADQESTVRTGHGTTDWFQIGKGVRQGCIMSPCLFNLYEEYIMRNAGLEEAQAGWNQDYQEKYQ